MTDDTLLLRQVHPAWVQNGMVTSQVFKPTPKDDNLISVSDGDQVTAAEAWQRHVHDLHLRSCGVVAVSVGECGTMQLPVLADGRPYPEHVSIDFQGLSGAQRETRSKQLRSHAMVRGWLYTEPSGRTG